MLPTVLIYLDSVLFLNRALTQAVERALESKNRTISATHRLGITAPALMDQLQEILDTPGEFCIVASHEAYPIASRIVATLNDDTLIATGETLHPATAARVRKDSFLIHSGKRTCNLLLARSGESIPEILLETGGSQAIWQLLGSESYLHALRQHSMDNRYHFEYFRRIEGWYEIHTDPASPLGSFLPYSDDLLLLPSANIFDTCIEVFSDRGERISFAESCTGGLIASSFTARSGSSNILDGSVVSYANEIKHRWLEVDEDILEDPGAVSDACVREMAEGAMKLSGSDIALATSGIAGPTGGTPFKPVGTVYIAVADRSATQSRHLLLRGDRNYIQYQAMMHALKLMLWIKKRNFEDFFNIS